MQLTNRIHFNNLQDDLFGGLTAAMRSLPVALVLSVASSAAGEIHDSNALQGDFRLHVEYWSYVDHQ